MDGLRLLAAAAYPDTQSNDKHRRWPWYRKARKPLRRYSTEEVAWLWANKIIDAPPLVRRRKRDLNETQVERRKRWNLNAVRKGRIEKALKAEEARKAAEEESKKETNNDSDKTMDK